MGSLLIVVIGIVVIVFIASVFILMFRSALDGSKTSEKLDVLIEEIRMLRAEVRNNKHIIDKKI